MPDAGFFTRYSNREIYFAGADGLAGVVDGGFAEGIVGFIGVAGRGDVVPAPVVVAGDVVLEAVLVVEPPQ